VTNAERLRHFVRRKPKLGAKVPVNVGGYVQACRRCVAGVVGRASQSCISERESQNHLLAEDPWNTGALSHVPRMDKRLEHIPIRTALCSSSDVCAPSLPLCKCTWNNTTKEIGYDISEASQTSFIRESYLE
jgi:hypothetical protein